MIQTLASPRSLRLALSALLVLGIAAAFWSGSRYPALDEKAMMSGAIQLEDSLSFEAAFPVTPDMGLPERIALTTLNWINTNAKGMTFGILFAAAFLTAAGQLTRRSFAGRLPNALLGLGLGAPLGVCVNCAAPIARGMHAAGLRAETTLAAMIASPTLNIVVLTMTFSLLPVYMAAAKLALSLAVILIAVPLIVRALDRSGGPRPDIAPPAPQPWSAAEIARGPASHTSPATHSDPAPSSCHKYPGGVAAGDGGRAPTRSDRRKAIGDLTRAAADTARAFAANLWFIARLTLPLMLLAGLLGASVAVLLPQEMVLGLPFSALGLLAVAAVGLFLPVPIAFDVVLSATLLGFGLAQGYVMALLFTLGTFSVYSALIVARSMGPRAAALMTGTLLALGILAGAGAEGWHRWQSQRALELLIGEAPFSLLARPAAASESPRVTVTARPLAPLTPAGETLFTRTEAITAGIDKPLEFSFRDMWPPFWEGRSLSAGDIDGDGDLDLAVASTRAGLYLYEGDGAGGFARIDADLGQIADWPVFNAALVDMDGDGLPDLVIATYRRGLWLWRNADGRFGPEPPVRLPGKDSDILAMALSFADADGDGGLDIAAGMWAAGWYRRIPGEESRNRLLWSGPSGLPDRMTDLPGIPGETLSILLSDIDGNGTADLLVGNDFDIPDYLYLGDGAGGFAMLDHASGAIPHTTTTTMAIKTGDLTGNGLPEIYFAQIAGRSSGVSETLKMQDLDLYCDGIVDAEAKATCTRNMEIKRWYRSGNSFDPTYAARCGDLPEPDRTECRAMLVKDLAIQRRDPSVCALIPAGQDIPRAFCDLHFLPARDPLPAEIARTHPQILRANVLLERQGAALAYADTAAARGLDVGGWSWDTKLEDFDLDGDLDMLIVNGTWVPNEVSPSNLYFENDGTGRFTESSGPAGLEDYLMTAAALSFDADGDGDPDLLTHPVNGPLALFVNGSQAPRMVVTLDDRRTRNSAAIGARLELTGPDGARQMREIQSGGGFMSFDAPRVHFALPAGPAATLRVRWPDGENTTLDGPLDAGALYTIRRD